MTPTTLLGPSRAHLLVVALASAGALAQSGCGGEPRTCGAGTTLQGESCVPIETECGPGTTLQDGECVADDVPPAPNCGPGTTLQDGECVADDPGDRCGPGTELVGDVCVPILDSGTCVPDCLGRDCGDDGCGGSCGACDDPARPQCDTATGLCVAVCIPQCAGRDCGDDGCGGICGTCNADATCQDAAGKCLPNAWSCDSAYYGDGAICDCGCGAPDRDCAPGVPLAGCEERERCNDQGECVPKAPPGWTCSPLSYAAHNACDCDCGVYDPDCDYIEVFGLNGCAFGVTECLPDGTCGTCTPDCTDKVCGGDGCGGSCGSCDVANDEVCYFGSCEPRCGTTPVVCLDSQCGDDGCGGSCGTCASGSTCQEGLCVPDPVFQTPFSCAGICGSMAQSGCYCTPDCATYGNCCADYAEFCTCTPDCTGKACGSDGCGGSCGTCGANAPYCTEAGQCTDQCTPKCDNVSCGDDGCGGSCGTCGAGETCYWTKQCVPSSWACDGVLYGDQQGCDCGCGAPDPDCAVTDPDSPPAVFGCPAQERTCGDDGICAISFCHSNSECGNAWCTGGYLESEMQIGGFCADPIADGQPPGVACTIDEECASLLCAGSQCRQHCQVDLDCPGEDTCVGLPVGAAGTHIIQGYAGVCETIAGSAAPCDSQASCGPDERCTVVMEPVSKAPRFVCAALFDESAQGRPCDLDACPAGYRCEDIGSGAVCTLPCPGGAADCGAGFACVDRPFSPLLQTGATVPLCLPE